MTGHHGTQDFTQPMAKTPKHPPANRERREYYRITDRVDLAWQAVPPAAFTGDAGSFFSDAAPLAVLRELREIDHDNQKLLRRLSDSDRELGQYLKAVNRKVDVLSSAITALTMAGCKTSPQSVSLSEGGIAFASDAELTTGDTLALRLILLPSYLCICCFATVVSEQPSTELGRMVSVRFESLSEAERKLLARHVLHRQTTERKLRLGL